MNAEDFRDHATAAVATIEPDAAAYDRIHASLGTRRGPSGAVWIAATTAAVVAIAGAAVAVSRGTHQVRPAAGVTGDIDGDGTADRVMLVTEGAWNPDWRWGIRAEMSKAGVQTVWRPAGEDNKLMPVVFGLADVDGNGTADVVASGGATEYGMAFRVATVWEGTLRWAPLPDQPSGLSAETTPSRREGWSCPSTDGGRRVVQITVTTRDGGATYDGTSSTYVLRDGTFTLDHESTAQWGAGSEPPGYEGGIHCAPLPEQPLPKPSQDTRTLEGSVTVGAVDLDGDGRNDEWHLVAGHQPDGTYRRGVRVVLTSDPDHDQWAWFATTPDDSAVDHFVGAGIMEFHGDIDGDGHDELFMGLRDTFWATFAVGDVVDGKWVFVTREPASVEPRGTIGWECRKGGQFAGSWYWSDDGGATYEGHRVRYSYGHGRLSLLDEQVDHWRDGEPRPAGYLDEGLMCGKFGVGP